MPMAFFCLRIKLIYFLTIIRGLQSYSRYYICINYTIPVGKNNRYGHPNKEVLDNLKDSKIYRTDIDGSIMFRVKK